MYENYFSCYNENSLTPQDSLVNWNNRELRSRFAKTVAVQLLWDADDVTDCGILRPLHSPLGLFASDSTIPDTIPHDNILKIRIHTRKRHGTKVYLCYPESSLHNLPCGSAFVMKITDDKEALQREEETLRALHKVPGLSAHVPRVFRSYHSPRVGLHVLFMQHVSRYPLVIADELDHHFK